MITFSHPSGFYMVVTYADSLFMASFLLLLAWGGLIRTSILYAFAAAAAGYVCSATRIVGAPLAALPVVWAWNDLWPSVKARLSFGALLLRSWSYALVSAATACGTIGFFVYCAVRFGHWDLYMRTRAAGWLIFKTDYSAMFALPNFDVSLPRFEKDFVSPGALSHTYLAAIIIALLVIPALDFWLCRRKPLANFSKRVPLYLAAWLIFFFSASGGGLREGHYLGFLRYGFYSQLPLILGVAHAREHLRPGQEIGFFWKLLIFLLCALALAIQAQFCHLFSHEIMVS
jgi:hypothetical protein